MILVAGATGTLGGTIARRLLEKGKEVRILVREGSDYKSLVEAGAQPVIGDLKDRASLDAAVQGVDTLVTTANSAMRGGNDNTDTVDTQGNRNLVDAARAAGVKHFIFTSILGADENHPVPLFKAKALTEKRLRESDMPYTILAPNAFIEVWVAPVIAGPASQGAPVTLVGTGQKRHSFVSFSDVADFAVAAVDNPAAINAHIPIGGPASFSYSEAVQTFSQVTGKEIPVHHAQPGEEVSGLPPIVTTMLAAFDTYESPVPMEEAYRTYGIKPTTLEDCLRRDFGAQ